MSYPGERRKVVLFVGGPWDGRREEVDATLPVWFVQEVPEVTLAEAFADDTPVLVNIFTNPESLAMPPHIEFEQLKGYMTSMGKMILGGRMNEVINTIRSNYKHLKEV